MEAKSDHRAGAQKDCLIAREAIQAMIDDNRTEPGSPDSTRFPRLHPLTEPLMVRGYNSQHVTDETSHRRRRSSFDDTNRCEVTDEIISPTLSRALDLIPVHQAKKGAPDAQEPRSASSPSPEGNEVDDPTHGMQALVAEATRRLQESNGVSTPVIQAVYPQLSPHAPPLQQDQGLGSWPLSRLADAAEKESRQLQATRNNHMFPPRVLPIGPFQPWIGFMPEPPPLASHQRQPQTNPPTSWPPHMQHMPISIPPSAPPTKPPSTLPKYDMSNGLPPPPLPPSQLQAPPQFMPRQQPLMLPYFVQQQQQPPRNRIQQPQPQPRAPHPPPSQQQSQAHPHPHPHPHLQSHTKHHLHGPPPLNHRPQSQPQPKLPAVKFIHQTIPSATATKGRNGTAATAPASAADRINHNHNSSKNDNRSSSRPRSGSGSGSGSGAGPPKKGGQRLLLPKGA